MSVRLYCTPMQRMVYPQTVNSYTFGVRPRLFSWSNCVCCVTGLYNWSQCKWLLHSTNTLETTRLPQKEQLSLMFYLLRTSVRYFSRLNSWYLLHLQSVSTVSDFIEQIIRFLRANLNISFCCTCSNVLINRVLSYC